MEVSTIIKAALNTKLGSLFQTITNDFGSEIEHFISNKILEYQVEEYNRNVITKTLLHRVQPKKLMDFYQPLYIIKCGQGGKYLRHDEKRLPTDSIKDLFKKKKYITLIGNAGSGKSTIVKYLFLNAIDTDYKIPVKVELRYLNDYHETITHFIKEKIFKLSGLANNDKIIERLLNSGKFVFFLDGYDEITSSKKEKTTKEIDDLVKLYNNNDYLLTSRPYTEIDLLPLFHNFQVCELSDEDINQFIIKQIPAEEKELCDKIIESVNNQENHSYKSFLSNPLLLSMFILTFQSYSNIPQKRSEFYSQVFDALFSVHDSMSKLAFVREKQSGLSKEYFIEILKLFSFISFFDDKFIFSGSYIEQKLSLIKQKKKTFSFDNDKLINDLQVAIGILNKEGTDFTFPHRSLQEYFAALYISSLDENNKEIVYKKIVHSLQGDIRRSLTFKDNFYLLLSELDEKGVIQYALIPFLKDYVANFDLSSKTDDGILSVLFSINTIYSSFNYILKTHTIKDFHFSLSDIYDEYMAKEDLDPTKPTTRSKNDPNRDGIRARIIKKLVELHVAPFLTNDLDNVRRKIIELDNFLESEKSSDSEIIALI
jgi:GTPase SAR1 family protein